jgi:hypothetical protein
MPVDVFVVHELAGSLRAVSMTHFQAKPLIIHDSRQDCYVLRKNLGLLGVVACLVTVVCSGGFQGLAGISSFEFRYVLHIGCHVSVLSSSRIHCFC